MNMKTYSREEIESVLVKSELIEAVEEGFRQYSAGDVVVPPVGHLGFDNPPGDVHIKYGAVKGADTFTIKVSNGFYDNPQLGLSSSQGVILVFSQKTGVLDALLFDQGLITDMRTAAAGAVAAKYLAPEHVTAVGVVGTGIQARLQIEFLSEVRAFTKIYVYGRHLEAVNEYISDMSAKGYEVESVEKISDLAKAANLIVTTTPAREAFLMAEDIQPGTHITAMGSDGPDKQEIQPELICNADVRVVDSRNQCFLYSDTSYALKAGLIEESSVVELGEIVSNASLGRTGDQQITFADLTGVAVQDIVSAELILAKLGSDSSLSN